MKGTPEMSVVGMTIPVTSRIHDLDGRIKYTMQFPGDVHIPGSSRSTTDDLKEIGAANVHYDAGGHSIHFVLGVDIELRQACRVVAGYLRWLHDFGGRIEFVHDCPNCGHKESFVL